RTSSSTTRTSRAPASRRWPKARRSSSSRVRGRRAQRRRRSSSSAGSAIAAEALEPAKPLLRGVLHQWAFLASLAAGGALVAEAAGARARVAAAVFAGTVATMFGASALYHRVTWQPRPRRWLRRLDHAMIYSLIAGTYTPFGLLTLSGAWRYAILGIAWTGAFVAIVLKFVWVDAPKWLSASIALALGWVGVIAVPTIVGWAGWTSGSLLVA